MKRLRSLLLALGLFAIGGVAAADEGWRPVTPSGAVPRLGAPVARLGQPAGRTQQATHAAPAADVLLPEDLGVFQRVQPVIHTSHRPMADGGLQPVSGFGSGGPSGEEQFNCGVVTEGPPPSAGGPGFMDRIFGGSPSSGGHPWMGGGTGGSMFGSQSFRSDHDFDYFISPVTNPFFFEDPRSLTEFRPLVIWQPTSKDNAATYGGNALFFSFQGRLALTERWSLVIHRLGFASVTVNDPPAGQPASPFAGGTSITDIQLGPKYTFWRDTQTGTVAAFGANFTIPVGSSKIMQGDGAVTPYITGAQKLGDFNLMGAAGYRFNFSGGGADMLFVSGHLDYNIANKFFPLVELNWYRYTSNGTGLAGSFDGADLYSTGATEIKGQNLLTVALGARYKFSESFQVGAAYELPLVGRDNFYRWRVTFDLIFRY